jgi:hypothetical protein
MSLTNRSGESELIGGGTGWLIKIKIINIIK